LILLTSISTSIRVTFMQSVLQTTPEGRLVSFLTSSTHMDRLEQPKKYCLQCAETQQNSSKVKQQPPNPSYSHQVEKILRRDMIP
jgi:hypothetical protein